MEQLEGFAKSKIPVFLNEQISFLYSFKNYVPCPFNVEESLKRGWNKSAGDLKIFQRSISWGPIIRYSGLDNVVVELQVSSSYKNAHQNIALINLLGNFQ